MLKCELQKPRLCHLDRENTPSYTKSCVKLDVLQVPSAACEINLTMIWLGQEYTKETNYCFLIMPVVFVFSTQQAGAWTGLAGCLITQWRRRLNLKYRPPSALHTAPHLQTNFPCYAPIFSAFYIMLGFLGFGRCWLNHSSQNAHARRWIYIIMVSREQYSIFLFPIFNFFDEAECSGKPASIVDWS